MQKTSRLFGALALGLTMALAGTTLAQNTGGGYGSNAPQANQPADGTKEKKKEDKGAEVQAKIGQPAPAFALKDLEGKEVSLAQFKGQTVVLEWFNPECPFVKKHHEEHQTMSQTYAKFKDKGVVWLLVNSGAPGQQGHGVALNAKAKKDWAIAGPVLIDESGIVGRTYGAKTTPHMFIINKDGVLVYNGAIDDNPSAKELGKVNYVEQALTQVLAGETVATAETKPYGCSVKYGRKN